MKQAKLIASSLICALDVINKNKKIEIREIMHELNNNKCYNEWNMKQLRFIAKSFGCEKGMHNMLEDEYREVLNDLTSKYNGNKYYRYSSIVYFILNKDT